MNKIREIYQILFKVYGEQGWWPVRNEYFNKIESDYDRFEVCIGAILTQNTSWKNVEKSIVNLRNNDLIDVNKLSSIDEHKLAELIRSSGYFHQKAKKLKLFANHIKSRGGLSVLFNQAISDLRSELLSCWGIGPETADSIILYSAEKPIFVIDAYTRRIMFRLGQKDVSYGVLQDFFHKSLESDLKLFNEFHALFVELAKRNCKKVPVCADCPLNIICMKCF